MRRLHYAVLLAAILCIALAVFSAINRTPWSDEGWFSSASYNLAHHGSMGTTVLEPAGTNFTRIDKHTYWVMPLFLAGQAAWYWIFPSDLLSTRVFTVLWIPLSLGAYYVFMRRLSGAVVAAVACIVLALTYHFIDNGGFARPDLMCMGLGVAGLAAYMAWRERNLIAAFLLANVFVALSIFTHPNGVYHAGALGALVLIYDRKRLSVSMVLAGAAPYVVLGAGWALYAMRDVEAFRDQLRANGTNGRWTATWNPIAIVVNEIRERYLPAYGFVTRGPAVLKTLPLLAYIAALAGVLASRDLRRRPDARTACILLAVYFCFMSVFNQKLSYYLIHIVPFYVAVLAIWLVWMWDRRPRLRFMLAGAVAVVLCVECAGIVLRGWQRPYAPALRPAVEFVKNRTGPNDRIAGTAALLYEFGFTDRLRDDMYLGLNSGRAPDVIVIENLYEMTYALWEQERPEDMRRIRARLAAYELVYDRAGYKVYVKPS